MTETAVYQTDTSDLHIPHNMFRTAFGNAGAVVDAVPRGDGEHAAAVSTYFDNLLRFLDAHHEGEDAVVWPRLRQRSDEVELLQRMEREHDEVHTLRAQAGAALEAWTAAPDDAARRTGLTSAMAALAALLDRHFGEEEAEIIPLASRLLSPEEWGELPGHAMQHFTGDKMWLILNLVFEQMTEAQRATILPHLPPPAVGMLTGDGAATFAAFISRVRP